MKFSYCFLFYSNFEQDREVKTIWTLAVTSKSARYQSFTSTVFNKIFIIIQTELLFVPQEPHLFQFAGNGGFVQVKIMNFF